MTRNRGRLLAAAAALLLVLLAVMALRPDPVPVDAAPAGRGPLRVTIDEDGVTRVRDRFVVTAPAAGRVGRIALEEGDRVEAGQVVARLAAPPLDPRTALQSAAAVQAAEAAVAEAGTGLADARAALAQARRDARRLRTLADAGGVSRADAEQAQLAAASAAQAVRAAEARVEAARSQLRSARAGTVPTDPEGGTVTLVRSPVAGRVLRVHGESAREVAPGAPLVELGDARALEVVVDVLSTDAVRVRPGMPVVIEEWGGDGALEGRVRSVSPGAFTKVSALGVEEQRVDVVADLVSPPASLGDGYRVEARIVTWQGGDVLKVPASALFRAGGGWSVFVVDDGVARLRPVRVGQRGQAEVQVLDGVAPGETVVLFPSDQIAEGVRVTPREEASEG